MLCAAVVPTVSEDSDAASGSWKCTITIDGTTITTKYDSGSGLKDTDPVQGNNGNAIVGSWAFDEKTGYGPFGSFYAAFDIGTGKMYKHLKPSDLTKTLDGESIDAAEYNVMWVIPTVWMKVTEVAGVGKSTLTMSGTEFDGAEAPAHTIDGKIYNYLAIGVYEAYAKDGKLYSRSGVAPTTNTSLADFTEYAKTTGVDTGKSMLWNFYHWQLYRFCSLAVMENFDSQNQIGQGNVGSQSSKHNTGTTNSHGPYYGTANSEENDVKLFIENVWGNAHELLGDSYMKDGIWAGQNSDQVIGTTTGLKKTTVSELDGYGTAPYSTNLDSWGLPTATAGYSTTAPDQFRTANSGHSLTLGGTWGDPNGMAGLSYLCDFADSNGSARDIMGSRLAFVFETDPTVSVKYDHSQLESLLEEYGYPMSLMSDLPDEPEGIGAYDQLEDVADFRHVGWIVDGVQYPATSDFAKMSTHTAKSVWVGSPSVTFDHSQLTDLVGKGAEGVSDLQTGMVTGHDSRYPQLPDTAGYRHVGWLIEAEGQEDVEVGPTDGLVSQQTHIARSIWKKIVIPIFPDDTDGIEVIVPDDSDHHPNNDGRTALLVAIVVAIIAELAVLCASRKR